MGHLASAYGLNVVGLIRMTVAANWMPSSLGSSVGTVPDGPICRAPQVKSEECIELLSGVVHISRSPPIHAGKAMLTGAWRDL